MRGTDRAHRIAAVALLVLGLVLFPTRPLVAFIVLTSGLAVIGDARGWFGRGIYRSMIGFITGLWLIVGGAIATFVGMFEAGCVTTDPSCDDPEGNLLFFPGLLLLAAGLTLVAWSVLSSLRMRRASH